MKCEKCKSREATTHVKTINNGEYKEHHLCSECAKEMGYGNMFYDFADDFNSLLGSFFGGNVLPSRTGATRCKGCGSTYYDIAKTGTVGCVECYSTFYNELLPSIRKIHGNTTHCGKVPRGVKLESQENKDKIIENMKDELKKAIDEQNFEKAAELRDKIKEMEEK